MIPLPAADARPADLGQGVSAPTPCALSARAAARTLVAALFAALVTAGCASPPAPVQPAPVRSYVVLLESPDGHLGAVEVRQGGVTTVLERRLQAVELDARLQRGFDLPEEQLQSDFAAALAARSQPPETFRLYFATGEAQLTPASERLVRDLIETVRSRAAADVSIIGHTDTQGDEASNRRLGMQRARWVARLLERYGLREVELTVTSHGERDPLVPTADETDEPRNRRVEVIVR